MSTKTVLNKIKCLNKKNENSFNYSKKCPYETRPHVQNVIFLYIFEPDTYLLLTKLSNSNTISM